ncbi:MAG: ANTAR domain-containing protein [Clostridiales bacterium]|nr:ANTAR domain-containing protein [Candidatus Crickella merdequi]
MFYNGRTYRMLLVSSSLKFNESFGSLLPKTSEYEMTIARDVTEAGRLMREKVFDFIVINRYPYDDKTISFAREIGQRKDCICMMFTRRQDFGEMHARLVESGVYILPKPVSADILAIAFGWLESSREQLRSKGRAREPGEAELLQVRRAKEYLMRTRHMTEDEAHVYISVKAMDACVSKAEIAAEILCEE